MTTDIKGLEFIEIEEAAKSAPAPRPRKHIELWQAYLWWDELMGMRMKHTLRLSACARGVTKMDASFEEQIIEWLTTMEKDSKKVMIGIGKSTGPIWEWLTAIHGIGDHTAAKLIAQFDDPGRFATVSKWWRFSGWAVIDGKRERNVKGEKSHYNRKLKSECYLVATSFIKQQTPVYVDIYYTEKARLRSEHPEPEPSPESAWPTKYTDSHIHRMAMRKMVKVFLCHFWVQWRTIEGLPVSLPYAVTHVEGHEHYIEPQAQVV